MKILNIPLDRNIFILSVILSVLSIIFFLATVTGIEDSYYNLYMSINNIFILPVFLLALLGFRFSGTVVWTAALVMEVIYYYFIIYFIIYLSKKLRMK